MSAKTGIGWTDATWNPVVGCTKVSQGCKHCYAKTLHDQRHTAHRAGKRVPAQYAEPFETVQLMPERLETPLRWRGPRRVFVNSMSDLFHEDVPDDFIDQVFAVMGLAGQHTFQVLTKRPERMRAYTIDVEVRERVDQMVEHYALENSDPLNRRSDDLRATAPDVLAANGWPLANVWLGTSVENQAAADERIPFLQETHAAVRFLSCEPLLGPIDLEQYLVLPGDSAAIDWVIVGGESGPGHRPMEIAWLEDLRAQCGFAGVPIFVKQDSGPLPGKQGRIPDDMWVQEFPA